MCKRMHATNRANTANLASLRNACRFAAALLLVFVALMALPAFAERPDIVWMAGGHAGGVDSVAFSPDGSMIASGSGDKTIKLWRVSDGKLLRTLEGHTGPVTPSPSHPMAA
jgi:WD40 repeat protein